MDHHHHRLRFPQEGDGAYHHSDAGSHLFWAKNIHLNTNPQLNHWHREKPQHKASLTMYPGTANKTKTISFTTSSSHPEQYQRIKHSSYISKFIQELVSYKMSQITNCCMRYSSAPEDCRLAMCVCPSCAPFSLELHCFKFMKGRETRTGMIH